jgi:FkbM family methyltransferase
VSDSIERIYLGNQRSAVRTRWGGWVVVPTFNVDVAIGVLRDGIIEPWTTRIIQELLKPGDVYFNAGANFGYYVALGGQSVGPTGRVIAVEPNPHILPFLMTTIYWSGLPGHAKIYKGALSDRAGEKLTFHFDPQFLGGGSTRSIWDATANETCDVGSFEEGIWSAESIQRVFLQDGSWHSSQGLFLPFETTTLTIDALCEREPAVSVIHLDVEGSEPFALCGAMATIKRSPSIKLVTEWSAYHYEHGTPALRKAFDDFWDFAMREGFRARHIRPELADDGGLFISGIVDERAMRETAVHGDYVWLRGSYDPWGA